MKQTLNNKQGIVEKEVWCVILIAVWHDDIFVAQNETCLFITYVFFQI
ncbi:MAG: hypothetical protein LBP59_03970 [Planctomycetaceae bacterium]|jgi:hypothetical protein|nr:hypothetical protein [Planctomycetaceae bacterium]